MRERGTLPSSDGNSGFSKFVQFVKTVSLSRTNRYLIEITGASAMDSDLNSNITNEQISLLCDYATHPAFSVHTKDARINNSNVLRPDGVIEYHNTASFSFLLDQDQNVKMYFMKWLNLVVDRDTQYVSYQDKYLSNVMKIHQLDMADNITYTTELYDVYPIEVGAVEVAAQAGNSFSRIPVQFAFKKWDGFSTTSALDMQRINQTYDTKTLQKFF